MPGMMPSQSGPKPGLTAFVPSLVGLEIPQMLQLFGDPNSPIPKNRVLAAIVEKQKEMAARKSVQNQMAMQQNAGQQPPIAQQVVAQAQQMQQVEQQAGQQSPEQQIRRRIETALAQGKVAEASQLMDMLKQVEQEQFTSGDQGYAGGGAVAFEDGGETEDLSDDPRLPLSERLARAQKRMSLSRQQGVGRSFAERFPDPAQSTTDTGDELTRMLGRMPAPVPMTMRDTRGATPETVAAARNLGTGQQRPPAAPAAAPAALMPGIRSTLTPEEQRMYDERKAALEGRKTLPADLLAGRAGLSALMQKNLAEERAEAETFGKEALAARDAALARAQRDVFSDPMALLGLAGTIDTRKGQGMGSFARGLSGIMGQREAAAEAARKEYATAQGTMRLLQSNIRRGNMLEAQRVQAMNEQEYGRVNQLDDAIAQNAAERAKLERDVQNKAFDQALESRKAAATERQARASEINAGKPTGTVALLRELGLAPTLENVGKLVEVQQGPKGEASIVKEIVAKVIANPFMLSQYPPEIQALVKDEIAKLRGGKPGATLKYNPATGQIE
jgi:hypothetical protein